MGIDESLVEMHGFRVDGDPIQEGGGGREGGGVAWGGEKEGGRKGGR